MCGRYQLEISLDEILNFIDVLGEVKDRYQAEELQAMTHPKKDIFPGSRALVLTREGLKEPVWGFPLEKKLVFNARAESLYEKPFFRQAAKKRRCLVPANLFYEWQGPEKIKHEVSQASPLFYLGGIYSRFPNAQGEPEERFSIITTASQGPMLNLHPRTPLIVSPPDLRAYLDPLASETQVRRILETPPQGLIICQTGPSQLSFF